MSAATAADKAPLDDVMLAMDVVAKAAPDGLTTGLFSIALFTALPAMMPRM